MSILSTNNKIVRVGDAYSAGSGIDITDKVISVSDDLLNEISAISATVSSVTGDIGSQIDYISGAVNDLSGDIDYISANAGRTYSGIAPIVVNNDENKISAATLQLSAGDNITLTEEGNIVRIDGQAGGGTTYTGDAQGALDEVYTHSGNWNGVTGKQDALTFGYDEQDRINSINNSALAGGSSYTGDAQGALDEVYTNSGNWNDISALNNKKDFDVQEPLIIAEDTVSSLKIGISGISATEWNDVYETVNTNSGSWTGGGTTYTGDAQGALDEVYTHSGNWNSVYDTVSTASGSWTGGGGGSIDTIPFVVNSPLTTGFTGDSAYIGLEDLTDYAKNSAFTFKSNYLTGVSGNRVSAYRTYSAYTARNAYTAANAQNAQTAQTAYYDSNGGTLVAFPSTGVLETTSTYTLKWNYNSGYFWDKEGSSPTPTGTSLYPVIQYYCNQNSSGASISGSNINITVSCIYGQGVINTGTTYDATAYLTAGETTSFTLNNEITLVPRSYYNNSVSLIYMTDNENLATVGFNYGGNQDFTIHNIGKYNNINIEGNQVSGHIELSDSNNNTISSIILEEASTINYTYTIPSSIQGQTVDSIFQSYYTTDWCSWTASKV